MAPLRYIYLFICYRMWNPFCISLANTRGFVQDRISCSRFNTKDFLFVLYSDSCFFFQSVFSLLLHFLFVFVLIGTVTGWQAPMSYSVFCLKITIIIIIFPLTARVVGAPKMIPQPVSSIFPVLHRPLGLDKLKACPFPDFVFPSLPLSALSSSSIHHALQDGFGQTWRTGDMTKPLQFASFTMVRKSSYDPIACWILARTSSLVTWSLYEMRSILQ